MNKIISIFVFSILALSVWAQPNWNVNKSNKQYSMTITGILSIEDVESTDTNDIIAAFVNDECRGVTNPVYVESLNRYIAFLSIFSNNTSGEEVVFYLFDDDKNDTLRVNRTQIFQSETIIGTPEAPHIFNYKTPSSETSISQFSFLGFDNTPVINNEEKSIEIELPNSADITSLTAVFELSKNATAQIKDSVQQSGLTANNFTDTVQYIIIAEDNKTQTTWNVVVSQAATLNNQAFFKSFSFDEQISAAAIDEDNKSISIEIASGASLQSLIATFELSYGATASINSIPQQSGLTANNFTDTVQYTVIAEDNKTQTTWNVVVSQAATLNNQAFFKSFSFDEQISAAAIDEDNKSISIEIASGASLQSLIATFELSYGATASINSIPQQSGITANDFTDTVQYTVIAEDNKTQATWNVVVSQAATLNNQAFFKSFSFDEQISAAAIDEDNKSISIEIASGASLQSLIATFELSYGATASINSTPQQSGITANDFSKDVVYKITAENGKDTAIWTVSVSVESTSNTKLLSSFSIDESIGTTMINPETKTIYINVENSKELKTLVVNFDIPTNAKAYINNVEQTSGQSSNDFSGTVVYQIVAQDGTESYWTVVSTTTSTDIKENKQDALTIHPTLVKNNLLFVNSNTEQKYIIFNTQGAVVKHGSLQNVLNNIEVPFQAGMYYIKTNKQVQSFYISK